MSEKELVQAIRDELEAAGDPDRARGMQAYMKSAMPYRGVPSPAMRAIVKGLIKQHPIADERAYWRAVLDLWRSARYREERYAAIELLEARAYRPWQTMDALPVYEELIVTGAWWDFVDVVATHRLGHLLREHPAPMKKTMRAWSKDENMWKRRSAILCQIGAKERTDRKLLYDCIAPSLSSKEFFLRKAIGWALRQYAWTDPDEVVRYVKAHEAELSALSKREALKNVAS
jgi:3-methyladenine DNA glycosylase AlkD